MENREHGNREPGFRLSGAGITGHVDQRDMPRFMTLIDVLSRMAHTVPIVIEPDGEC